jgi:pilus assembly protein Flp/PilA
MFNNLIHFVTGLVVRMRHNEEGQTMAEYGILIAFIAIIVIVAAQLLGTNLLGLFNSAATKV